MKKVIVIMILIFVSTLFLFSMSAEVEGGLPVESRIKNLLKDRLGEHSGAFGIVVGIVDETGKRVVSFGNLDKKSNRAIDGDSLFNLCSVTKVLTASLLSDMVARGEVSLDDPIDKYLPKGTKTPTWEGRKITLRHLVTHTSGLPTKPDNSKREGDQPGYVNYTAALLYQFLSSYTLTRDVGEKFDYSNLGMGLLGHILSLRAGKPFVELLHERIIEPLGMKDTAFRKDLSPVLRKNLTTGHYNNGVEAPHWDMSETLQGAGGLHSTANDMLTFLAANMELVQSTGGKELANGLTKKLLATHQPQKELKPHVYVGLGWLVSQKDGKHYVLHTGGVDGYRSFIAIDKQNKRAVVVMTNSIIDIFDIGDHLLVNKWDELEKTQAAKKNKEKKKSEAVSVEPKIVKAYKDYAGLYEITPTFQITITTEDNRLFAQGTGQPRFELFPEGENKFYLKAAPAKATFVRDDTGKVTKIIIHSSEGDEVGKKLK